MINCPKTRLLEIKNEIKTMLGQTRTVSTRTKCDHEKMVLLTEIRNQLANLTQEKAQLEALLLII